ncbi:MAG: sulfite exporter TauE/SafE family protein [Betaproteobacteria bacterium]|nr:sulfite exporter TauE/SafE family protein [Betaproteobacteria bacterium]
MPAARRAAQRYIQRYITVSSDPPRTAPIVSTPQILELAVLFLAVATLYSAVGHAGASGYLAAMALVGVAPDTMRPVALSLNIAVAAFTTFRFRQARFFDAKVVLPFLIGSVPFAFLGGALKLPASAYQALVGAVLLVSAAYLGWRGFSRIAERPEREVSVPRWVSPIAGALIGLLSGLTGTGGGIFLSPLVLLMGWAGPKATAGIAAPFIMVNSVAGLAGGWVQGHLTAALFPTAILPLALVALGGAWLGTWLGIHKLTSRWLIATLALVMSIAAFKMIGMALR